MEYIRVTKDNLEKEHICCAISNNKDVQVSSKKAWLADRFDEGLVFLKSVERGKCFIEYIPAENAWVPIDAAGYMYIDCLWVSGSFKGHGYSTDLLNACIEDSREKGKKGLWILAAANKKPFLADPKFLKYKGFITGSSSGIWPLTKVRRRLSSKSARGIRISTKMDMCYTTPASARSTRSTCRYWKRLPKRTAFRSARSISGAGRRRRTRRRRSRRTRCSATASILRMSR